uniref:uncharacterized protein n=1 Tax=Myxine glutinosa TaxID=7769 RepID=UPI00358F1183
MESRFLPNEVFSASSSDGNEFSAHNARLYNSGGYWRTHGAPGEYLHVNFESDVDLTGIVVQGSTPELDRARGLQPCFVTSYNIEVKNNNWQRLSKMFQANFDTQTPVRRLFRNPLMVSELKIIPSKWNGSICLRMELLATFRKDQAMTLEYTPHDLYASVKIHLSHLYTSLACYILDFGQGKTSLIGIPPCKYGRNYSEYYNLSKNHEEIYNYSTYGVYTVTVWEIVPTENENKKIQLDVSVNKKGCRFRGLSIEDSAVSKKNARTLLISQELVLMAVVKKDCLASQTKLLFHWTADNGQIIQLHEKTIYIKFKAFTFTKSLYKISVQSQLWNLQATNMTTSIYVNAVSSPLVLLIKGSSKYMLSSDYDQKINATESYDPDEPSRGADGITFRWTCTMTKNNGDQVNVCRGATGPLFLIKHTRLEENGTLTVLLTAEKGDQKQHITKIYALKAGVHLNMDIRSVCLIPATPSSD